MTATVREAAARADSSPHCESSTATQSDGVRDPLESRAIGQTLHRRQVWVWCRLAGRTSSSPDTMTAKCSGQSLVREHALDLGSQRARRDGQRALAGEPLDRFAGAREQHRPVAARAPRVTTAFRATRFGDGPIVPAPSSLGADLAKRTLVVVAEIARVVVAPRSGRRLRSAEHVAKRAEVQRLAVGDDAIEVEDDRRTGRLPFGLDALAGFESDRQPVLLRRERADRTWR